MSDIISKIQDFFFDILGLMFPGVIFTLLFIAPIVLFDFSQVNAKSMSETLHILSLIKIKIHKFYQYDRTYFFIAFIGFGYIMGHLVKVFSIIAYEVLEAIFDRNINRFTTRILRKTYGWLKHKVNSNTRYSLEQTELFTVIYSIFSPIIALIKKIFTFRSPSYFKENDLLRSKCVAKLNERTGQNFPDKWYTLYKFSVVLHIQENILSLTQTFLAKYNLYRSLSFIFMTTFLYLLLFFSTAQELFPKDVMIIKNILLLIVVLLWFTFHVKYKRYWTLCGNEALVSLFYFLNKGDINRER